MKIGRGNLIWIRNLFKYDQKIKDVSYLKRLIASGISVATGVFILVQKGIWIPLAISLLIITVVSFQKSAKLFFNTINIVLFFAFQTITLFVLIIIFYLIIAPLGILYRRFAKNDSTFTGHNKNTLLATSKIKNDYERLF